MVGRASTGAIRMTTVALSSYIGAAIFRLKMGRTSCTSLWCPTFAIYHKLHGRLKHGAPHCAWASEPISVARHGRWPRRVAQAIEFSEAHRPIHLRSLRRVSEGGAGHWPAIILGPRHAVHALPEALLWGLCVRHLRDSRAWPTPVGSWSHGAGVFSPSG